MPKLPVDIVATETGGPNAPRRRRARAGPESALVDEFVANFPLRTPSSCQTTIFREPKLTSGFPDVVAVTWHLATARRWSKERRQLRSADARLIHLLASYGPTHEDSLREWMGRAVFGSLERLEAAGLVRMKKGGIWHATSVREGFAVRRIVSFEAKISDWRTALEQAGLNLWFASESYVVLPQMPRSPDAPRLAALLGVGIWIAGALRPAMSFKARKQVQPVSFASWLFNDWAWHGAV